MINNLPQSSLSKSLLSDENFSFLKDKIYDQSGIVLERPKQYLLEARLTPVARRRQLGSLNELCKLVRSTPDSNLLREVVEAITTHETFFFRDQSHYEILRTQIIPELLKKRQQRCKLRFWSAAASCGQEAYSLAMMLAEMGIANWNFEIVGTDLSERILNRARSARYNAGEVARGLPAEYLKKYFHPVDGDYQLRDDIRRAVQFRQFDLRSGLRSLGSFDVVFCRNVMIYFDQGTKRKILEDITSVLVRDGVLFLGSTETTIGITERFKRNQVQGAVYYTGAVA